MLVSVDCFTGPFLRNCWGLCFNRQMEHVTSYDGQLNIAARNPCTEAEGPGKRFALWVQGCHLRCPGCCNPHMLQDQQIELVDVDAVAQEIIAAQDAYGIEGVTFIGGEPFQQAASLAALGEVLQNNNLSVMIFSGFTMKALNKGIESGSKPEWQRLLDVTDLLVDGPYIEGLHTTERRWIGSTNQKIHFLSERYLAMQEAWSPEKNTIEIRMKNGVITVNGFPHPDITALLQSLGE